MKIIELIQRVQSLYSKGVQSDDSRLTSRHIYNKLISSNNFLTNKKLSKNINLSDNYYYNLKIEIENSPLFKDICILPATCNISKSICQIPDVQIFKNKYIIKFISSLDGEVKFNYIDFNNLKYLSGNKYTKNKQWYFIKDKYIYFIHSYKMKKVIINAYFKDITQALTYNCNDDYKCIDILEQEFPTDDDMIEPIIELTLKELVSEFSVIREDLTNDNKDSLLQNSK